MVLNRIRFLPLLVLAILVLSACSAENNLRVVIPEQRDAPVPTVLPQPIPERVLSICLGDEPGSLFLYGDQSLSARIIRQAIYDWTVDENQSLIHSAAISEIPSLANGMVALAEIEVSDGERIVDAYGNLTILSRGTVYRPAGCADPSCWETFDQSGSVIMDQLSVDFSLRTDLIWSDGTPVTPEDSLFSFQTASLVYGARGPKNLIYSSSYRISEEGNLRWTGIPGYQGVLSYADLFFDPLPAHLWSGYTRDEFLLSENTTLQPLGWGAYRIIEWVQGDHLTLNANPNYPGSLDYDALVFRFMNGPEEALAAYYSGECQIVSNQSGLQDYQADLRQAVEADSLRISLGEAKAWEQISFGVDSLGRSRNFLASAEIRQALAGCVDREKLALRRLEAGGVVDGFSLVAIADQNPDFQLPVFDPVGSGQLLKDLGWIDHDGDPDTPRRAESVEGISPGSSLELVLLTADTDIGKASGQLIADGLASCGVGVEVENLPPTDLLAPGPEGPIFGRQFDLAYFAWAAGNYQPCRLYLSDEVPGLYPDHPKGWGGVNAAGFRSEAYDAACRTVLTSLPDLERSKTALSDAAAIYREELPSLPLFFRRDILLSSPRISGLADSIFPTLWDIESLSELESGE